MIVLLSFLLLVLVVPVAVTVPGKPVEVEAQTAPRTKDMRELLPACQRRELFKHRDITGNCRASDAVVSWFVQKVHPPNV